jgi:quercetin dioxygenase-like cupin family protein
MAGIRRGAALLTLAALALLGGPSGAADAPGAKVTPVASNALPNVPGKRLTAVVVDYAAGGTSPAHHHAGSVFAYVLAGRIRSQVSDGPVAVFEAGQSFFEPPGSRHLVSENASQTEPARLLAIFIADEGATLTTFDR